MRDTAACRESHSVTGKRTIAPVEDTPEPWGHREEIQRICPPDSTHNVAIHLRTRYETAVLVEQLNVSAERVLPKAGPLWNPPALKGSHCQAESGQCSPVPGHPMTTKPAIAVIKDPPSGGSAHPRAACHAIKIEPSVPPGAEDDPRAPTGRLLAFRAH